MIGYVAQRLGLMAVTVVGMSIMVFIVTHVLPGDPAQVVAGLDATPAIIESIRTELGLDRPLYEQYARYVGALARGDFGRSFVTKRPVSDDLRDFFPATVELALYAMAVSVAISLPLGVLAASRQGRYLDGLTRLVATAGAAMPIFWLGLMLQILLYSRLGWLPSGYRLDPSIQPPPAVTGLFTIDALLAGEPGTFVDALYHLILPVTVLALGRVAVLTRMTRASVLEVLRLDFVRTARAKGLNERTVLFTHVLKNAGLPILTTAGIQLGLLLGGTVLTETIFQWPGVGQYVVSAISNLDFNSIIGVTIVVSAVFVAINLIVDLLYAYLDPRIRY